MNLNDFFSKPTRVKEAYTSNYPSSTPADAAAAVSSGKAIDDPDIMGSLRSGSQPAFDRLNKSAKDPGQIQPLDSEEEEALNNHLKSWQEKIQNLPDPFAPTRTWTRADGTELPASGAGSSSNIAPHGWRYVEKDADPSTYTFVDPKDQAASKSAAAAGALPNLKFDMRSRSLVPVDGSGANPNIDADTRARALAWAARKNAPGGIRAQDVGPDNSVPSAPAASLKDLPVEKPGSWKDIAQANNLTNPNLIMPGQKLKIPGRADYVVQPGDTLAKIAAGQTQTPKITPTAGDLQPAAVAKLKKNPNIGVDFPVPTDIQKSLGTGPQTIKTYDPFGKEIIKKVGSEELVTPEMIRRQKQAAADISAIDKKMQDRAERAANRKKTNEDDIDNQTQVSSFERDWTTDNNGQADHHFSSTSFQTDPNDPSNNSYMDRQEHNGVATQTYAKNVTPKWMSNLKSTAGAAPAPQPPSQYPTKAGQGMNNRPFAAYSTPPGEMEVTREGLDRMQSLAGIHKK